MGKSKGQLDYEAVRQDQIVCDPSIAAPTYIGRAEPGALTSEKKWQICKLSAGSLYYADGSSDYVKVWDNRATYDYTP